MKRSPGRPPLDDDDSSTEVGVTIPTKQFDDYAKRALHTDATMPETNRPDLAGLNNHRTD